MISKRVYLFLTGGLLLLSIGTGFTMQRQHEPDRIAMQALETARLQLHKASNQSQSAHQSRALRLIREAMQEIKAGSIETLKPENESRPTAG
jgi:hypothetical protein